MKHLADYFFLRIAKCTNVIMMTVSFGICWFYFYSLQIYSSIEDVGNGIVIFLFCALYIIFAKIYDAFFISQSSISELIFSQILAVLITDGFLFLIMILLKKGIPAILPFIIMFAVQCLIAVLWAYISHRGYFIFYRPKRSVIIYRHEDRINPLIHEYGLEKQFEIEQTESVTECLLHMERLNTYEAVFLTNLHSHERNVILKHCVAHDIEVYVMPRIGDVIMKSAKQIHLLHLPIYQTNGYSPSPEYLLLKRLFDIIASCIAVLFLSPVMLATAFAIKLEDKGPVLYKQRRYTQHGRIFDIYKFRSMKTDAEKDGVARLSTGDADDRVTSVGRVIRKYRIDELPQLFNIIKGDLSICGPRPERPEIAELYEKELPEFRLRLLAKAGLTGYAQVYGKYNTSPYDKLQMDLMYLANPGFWQDLCIMFATLKVLFTPESTEGIQDGSITAMKEEMEK